jgi:hypothetical protein
VPDQEHPAGLINREHRYRREQQQLMPDRRPQPCHMRRHPHPRHGTGHVVLSDTCDPPRPNAELTAAGFAGLTGSFPRAIYAGG